LIGTPPHQPWALWSPSRRLDLLWQVLTPIIASVKAEAPAGSAADERPLLRTGVADEDEPMQDALEEAEAE